MAKTNQEPKYLLQPHWPNLVLGLFQVCLPKIYFSLYAWSTIRLVTNAKSFRWNVQMPAIIAKSISILSDAGLGMAMFSLGMSDITIR